MSDKMNFTIPDELKAIDSELMKLALAKLALAKQKQEKKAEKRVKKELTPEQQREIALKALTKKLAEANGVKIASRDYSNTNINRRGNASLRDDIIFQTAEQEKYTHIFLRKGKKSEYKFCKIELDVLNQQYILEGKKYQSLFDAHKAFCPEDTFGKEATLRSSYFGFRDEQDYSHRVFFFKRNLLDMKEKLLQFGVKKPVKVAPEAPKEVIAEIVPEPPKEEVAEIVPEPEAVPEAVPEPVADKPKKVKKISTKK